MWFDLEALLAGADLGEQSSPVIARVVVGRVRVAGFFFVCCGEALVECGGERELRSVRLPGDDVVAATDLDRESGPAAIARLQGQQEANSRQCEHKPTQR